MVSHTTQYIEFVVPTNVPSDQDEVSEKYEIWDMFQPSESVVVHHITHHVYQRLNTTGTELLRN